MTFDDGNNCGSGMSDPVELRLISNTFTNNIGENVLFVDLYHWNDMRRTEIINNTFANNSGTDLFPGVFRRSTKYAVVVLKEGNFTLHENMFVNPNFTFQISTILNNFKRTVAAQRNWWGTEKECDIREKIFDFEDRVQLARIDYFPYLASPDTRDVVSENTTRKSCFLQGHQLDGALDETLVLNDKSTPYIVKDDLIVLPNGSLTIAPNVTLIFPPRSVFVVQGHLSVEGTVDENVKFTMQRPSSFKVRLVGGVGPWAGRVEMLYNDTWISICLGYSSFSNEGQVVCQQLGYTYHYYRYREQVLNIINNTNDNNNNNNNNNNNDFYIIKLNNYPIKSQFFTAKPKFKTLKTAHKQSS